jgi:hypothetical protein
MLHRVEYVWVPKRVKLLVIIDAIHSGELETAETPIFHLKVRYIVCFACYITCHICQRVILSVTSLVAPLSPSTEERWRPQPTEDRQSST